MLDVKLKLKSSKGESCGDLPYPTTRQNYYFGKLLTAADLQSEQRYLNEKRWMINRYGIGWGVLCGLKVTAHPDKPCTVCIEPGMALDRYGNEIIVCEPQCDINLQTAQQKLGDVHRFYITITYRECAIAPSPITVGTCDGYETDCAYNRTLETFTIGVTSTEPDRPGTLREDLEASIACEAECFAFLHTPGHVVNESCPPRPKGQPLTLACVELDPATHCLSIDNVTYRKLAYSNELLYALMQCMLAELWATKGAHHDRRRYVPLLANTIKGLQYQDGKITEIQNHAGVEPFRLTTDGDAIWVTDRGSTALIRFDRQTHARLDPVDLGHPSWGIAFDGDAMWMTHPDAGLLTRIRTCNCDERWTCAVDALPWCNPDEASATDASLPLPPQPQELVYHQGLLYVSHGWDAPASSAYDDVAAFIPHISIIDTRRCCRLKTIPITSPDYMRPVSPILAMASDGDALWIVYRVRSDREGYPNAYTVLRRIPCGAHDPEVSIPYEIRDVSEPGKLAFDGTHLWLTHEHGASRIRIDTGREDLRTSRTQKQVGLAFGAGEYMWSSEVGQAEARLNRIHIFTAQLQGEVEFVQDAEASAGMYAVNDVQFDGAFFYVVGGHYAEDNTPQHGRIHRILP